MKKLFYLLATTAIILAGCSKVYDYPPGCDKCGCYPHNCPTGGGDFVKQIDTVTIKK